MNLSKTRGQKKRGKTERQKAVAECDKQFSLYIRARDGYKSWDGGQGTMCCNHLFSRVNYATRWHEDYSFCGTVGANLRHEYSPEIMNQWFIAKYGLEKWEYGIMLHKSVFKISTGELWLQAKVFKQKHEAVMEAEGT